MKTFKNCVSGFSVLFVIFFMMGCDQKIGVESVVDENGGIDRTIVFTEVDSVKVKKNIFGLHAGNGWNVETKRLDSAAEKTAEKKYTISFRKRFPSANDSNLEFDNATDSVFHIKSSFDKKFRWFYTYLYYSDTYRAINRFRHAPQDDFFTPEDMSFIGRLPAEGEPISKADSIFLSNLTDKIYGHYAMRGIFEENFEIITAAANKNNVEQRWIDSLNRYKENMFSLISKDADDDLPFDEAFMLQLIDSVKIAFPVEKIQADYKKMYADILPRIQFMTEASQEGKFTHGIELPWQIVETNADSVSGSRLLWHPPTIKFALSDYTMYATARKLNYWSLVLSAVILMLTVLGFVRRRRRSH
jgi:hypothetical protein